MSQKKVNPDDLMYKYKGPTSGAKHNESLNLIDKIREGEISLADTKKSSNRI